MIFPDPISVKEQDIDKQVYKIMGWFQRDDDMWLNKWGAPVCNLPRLSSDHYDSQIVVRHFEEGTFTGKKERVFNSIYFSAMTPMGTCLLAILVSHIE